MLNLTNFSPEELDSAVSELIRHELSEVKMANKSQVNPDNNELQSSDPLIDAFMRYDTQTHSKEHAPLSPAAKVLKDFINEETKFFVDQAHIYRDIISDLHNITSKVKSSDTIHPLSKSDLLNLLDTHKRGWAAQLKELPNQSPEAYLAVHGVTLDGYQEQYKEGRIIRTPYVESRIERINEKVESKGVVIIGGHTGLGKTEVARIVSKDITGKEPVVVRGHPDLQSEEMFGSQKLEKSDNQFPREVVERIKQEHKAYEESLNGETASAEDLEAIKDKIIQENSVTISKYILKGVYQALKEGRVCLIDEGNYIDPGLIAKLNDILTKKPGEYIDIQEDGGEKLCLEHPVRIILTGNFNQTGSKVYLGRKELDPAFVNRAGYVHYDVLPQETLGKLEDCNDPLQKQLFTITLVPLMSERGGYIVPKDFKIESLWELSKLSAVSQLAFSGNLKGSHPLAPKKDAIEFDYNPKVQISNRRLISLIESWRDDGFVKPLDYYLYQNFSDITEPQDRFFYYEMAKKSGFFQEDVWPSSEEFRDHSPDAPQLRTQGAEVRLTKDLIEAIYGPPPVRESWGESGETSENLEEIAKKEMELTELMKEVKDILEDPEILRHLNNVCPL